jgi:hypothetical protein
MVPIFLLGLHGTCTTPSRVPKNNRRSPFDSNRFRDFRLGQAFDSVAPGDLAQDDKA